jgi:DNA-binding beta-propeller fold protein YncE
MGTTNGKILRFTQGKENTFFPKGVDPAFGTRLLVYTSDDTKNIYVLDSQNNRVVVLDKEGTYIAQYRFDAASAPMGLSVFEAQKKLILLSDGKLFGIDLK